MATNPFCPLSSFQRKLESRKEGRVGEGIAGFAGWRVGLSRLLSFPLCGNGLSQPLDSGLRRAATGILPSRRIQNFLSINDEGGWSQVFVWNGKGAVGIAINLFHPHRHSGAGRNPGRRAGGVKRWQALRDSALGCRVCSHSRYAGMAFLNHWIPACAGMTVSFRFRLVPGGYGHPRRLVPDLPAAGRCRSAAHIPAGVSINDDAAGIRFVITC